MTSTQALSNFAAWQQWDGRIVNATFPLVRYLGGSEHSAVYLTNCDGVRAVIKMIPADAQHTSAQVESWELARQLSHPNLVRVLETGLWHADEKQDMRFAIMEYCDESLARVIRERRLTPDEARNMLGPALDALKYLHSRGMLHGQIKPAQILASGETLKLSSDTVHRNGEAHPSLIPSPYDAPEKAGGTISLGGDVWSLGVTLFEVLTGHLPGADNDGNFNFAAKLPPPFGEIVTGCLTPDREQRLSVSAIRGLLDRPVKNAADKNAAETIPITQKSTGNTLEKPISSGMPTAPTSISVPSPPVEQEEDGQGWNQRMFLMIGVGILLLLAIVISIRMTRKSPGASPSAPISARQTTVAPAPSAAGTRTASQAPGTSTRGSVLHQVMPDIAAPARNTITGTVKVRIKVAVAADGKVTRAMLATRAPSTYFARQSLEAVRRWSFVAPIRNGTAQASEWILRFEFRKSGTKVTAQSTSGT